jgi:hypothetical protein
MLLKGFDMPQRTSRGLYIGRMFNLIANPNACHTEPTRTLNIPSDHIDIQKTWWNQPGLFQSTNCELGDEMEHHSNIFQIVGGNKRRDCWKSKKCCFILILMNAEVFPNNDQRPWITCVLTPSYTWFDSLGNYELLENLIFSWFVLSWCWLVVLTQPLWNIIDIPNLWICLQHVIAFCQVEGKWRINSKNILQKNQGKP